MVTQALMEIPVYAWLVIGGYVLTILCIVIPVVWKVGQVRSDVRDANTRLSGRVDLVQQTVTPYSEEISGLKRCVADLQQSRAGLDQRCDGHDRDIKRLEDRIESMTTRR